MTLGFANDHAGYALKLKLVDYLSHKGFECIDLGSFSEQPVDYPDFGHKLAIAIENGEIQIGFSICGSGNGISMTANKHQGIRSALCWNKVISHLARSHNDANICSLPGRFISDEEAFEIVDIFLNTPFEGGRHTIRIEKIPIKI